MAMLRSFLIGLLAASMVLTSAAMALARTAPNGQTIVICTGMGISTVTLDAQGNEMAPAPICPDCLVQQLAALIAPSIWTLPLSFSVQPYLGVTQVTNLASEQVQAAARGPPPSM